MASGNAEWRRWLAEQNGEAPAKKPRAKPKHTESRLQEGCVRWFRLQYPKYARLFFSIPNGAKMDPKHAVFMVREGMLKGVADMMLAVPAGGYHGLFIEFKTNSRDSQQSDDQVAFQAAAQAMGYKYIVVRDAEQFVHEIYTYLHQ